MKLCMRRLPPLNSVCPYYTMFPIEFPRRVLAEAEPGDTVLHPFCGRGTTLYAVREAGLEAHGTDVSSVAIAISRVKLAVAKPTQVMRTYDRLMADPDADYCVPRSRFWRLAYHMKSLRISASFVRPC